MTRLLRAALVLPTLVFAHQLVFLARYGSIYGEALAHEGHGPAWTGAVTTVSVGSGLLLMAALVGVARLSLELRRSDRGASRAAPVTRRAIGGLVGDGLRRTAVLTALTLIALTVQENLEHAAAGLGIPGPGILVSREYPFAVGIVALTSLAIAVVASLITWRRAILVARLRAARVAGLHRRRPLAIPSRALDLLPLRPGQVARQLGRRAPPLRLPA